MSIKAERAGFTLIEVMITVFGFALISLGLFALVSGLLTGTNKQADLLADTDMARKLAFNVSNELRRITTSVTGSYGLEQAGSQQIIFYSNIDTDPEPERIRYYLSGDKLYKGVIQPSGSPLNYNGSEVTTLVLKNVANGTAPIFYYYDGTYTGVNDNFMAQPVGVTQVKYVRISINIYNKAGVANTNTYTVVSGASLRSLKANLGN